MKLNFYNINSSQNLDMKLKAVYTILVDEKKIENIIKATITINIRLKEFWIIENNYLFRMSTTIRKNK